MRGGTIAVAAPSFGPAVVNLFGLDVPVLALFLSVCGLLLARSIAPPPLRKLSRRQEAALTCLLVILLFLIVTGALGTGRPLGAGMSVMMGLGLGFSGLLAVEFFSERAMAILRALINGKS